MASRCLSTIALSLLAGCGDPNANDSATRPGDTAPADGTGTGTDPGDSSGDAADTTASVDTGSTTGVGTDFDPQFVIEQANTAIANTPGLAVAVVYQGEVVFAEGFGVADDAGNAVATDTLFNLASCSKIVTAMTVLSLRDEGALTLDTPVPQIVPSFALRTGFDPASITIRHLLTHTSGIGDWPTEPFVEVDGLLDSFVSNGNQPLWAEPGAVWNYSNRGFTLAGLVAASADGGSFAGAVASRVLTPLGMPHATMDASIAATRTFARGHAQGQGWVGPLLLAGESLQPSAGLWASAEDLGPLVRALATGHADGIADGTLAEMASPQAPTLEWPGAHYGYGLFVDEGAAPVLVSHGGSISGYLTDIQVVPELGFGVAVTTNGDTWNPGEMTYAIVDHYAGPIEFPAVDPTPLTLGSIPGAWYDQWQLGHITITDTGSGLEIAFTDFGKTFPLERYSEVAFSTTHPQDGVQFEIVVWPDAEGNARWLVSRAGVAAKL
ncbi:MAG: beta-lactamase family protein [Deltaproteobacteria bacterium]|nr:beta-lactamase family protein [Deltaproteobacteria bacterium]MBK8720238.1 beta-lactamase family protein [Deltaproteobacteria bacterium]MBP7287606.1 beta-lactamase family protein [Nannocystaceae bacterium]